jgi:biotin synthase
MELVFQAATVHRAWFDPSEVQLSQLLSVKTGGCAENCGYCSQSAHFKTGLKAEKLMDADVVIAKAREARDGGAQRFCMGAAWRELKDRDLPKLAAMIGGVKALGLETCATLGMLTPDQAKQLKDAGLDYYNHNLDTGPEYYGDVVTTRTYQERLDTLAYVRDAGMSTCCGGIVGMGETRRDRASLLRQLATLPSHPDSLPINGLVPVSGTPLGDQILADGADGDRLDRVRAHHRRGPHRLPQVDGPPVGRPRRHEPRAAGPVLPGRRQFDLRRRQAADHAPARPGRGPMFMVMLAPLARTSEPSMSSCHSSTRESEA